MFFERVKNRKHNILISVSDYSEKWRFFSMENPIVQIKKIIK
ncbi:hypothetical protein DJ66_0659 [Candidatus Liberibacter solanacearum]|uniref:Uncharacterized protein n=1 Tax=Candidatus Liberibacter solanacearum TaxID=556287 RepID=A0A0F4VKL3_9HYPH|nr:hypothetical protein DJ66_0659 [Candidatus Liberibacter solanacearum]